MQNSGPNQNMSIKILEDALTSAGKHADELEWSFHFLEEHHVPYLGNEVLYEALIAKAKYSGYLARGFFTLIQENIFYKQYEFIYTLLIQEPLKAVHIVLSCIPLLKANIPYEPNKELYHACQGSLSYTSNEQMVESFLLLFAANIDYQNNPELYQALIQRSHSAKILAKIFIILMQHDILYHENVSLYKLIIDSAPCERSIHVAIDLMQHKKISYHQYPEFYKTFFLHASNADTLAECFTEVIVGHLLQDVKDIFYQALLQNHFATPYLAKGLCVFFKEKIPYTNHEALYDTPITSGYNSENLAHSFLTLAQANFPYAENKDLYAIIINHSKHAQILVNAILILQQYAISYQHIELLIEYIDLQALKNLFTVMCQLNITPQICPQYFSLNLLIKNHKIALFAVNKLKEAGYSLNLHTHIFDNILTQLNSDYCCQTTIITNINKFYAYAQNNILLARDHLHFPVQLKTLARMTSSNHLWFHNLIYGPLEKNDLTTQIEFLLEKIVNLDIYPHDLIYFNSQKHYILALPGQNEINLSLIIKHANLSQLVLKTELIEKIEKILRQFYPNETYDEDNPIVKLLPPIQQLTIGFYAHSFYKNINKFLRSSPLKSDSAPYTAHKEVICFLLNCLLHDAINKLRALPDRLLKEKILVNRIAARYQVWISDYVQKPETFIDLLKQAENDTVISPQEHEQIHTFGINPILSLYKTKFPLIRGEKLKPQHIQGRLANPYTLPALTSFSAHTHGCANFLGHGQTCTIVENPPHHYIINTLEAEILLPQGEQVITLQGPGYFISRIVRTPLLEKNDYWSELALTYAHTHHLTQDYKDQPDSIFINNINIPRPNHNSPPTYRGMLTIELIVSYFSYYAKDIAFRDFCTSLSKHNIEWLKSAAAFRFAGRESETSTSTNLEQYESYKESSTNHFALFVYNNNRQHEAISYTMAHIIRYMGNPQYETECSVHVSPDKKNDYHFFHRILNMAHKLDLARCFTANAYRKEIDYCKDLSISSSAQNHALCQIIQYNIALIKAHGQGLLCDIQPDGTLIEVNIGHKPIFAKVSHSLHSLFEISKTISIPHLENAMQDNSALVAKIAKLKLT